MPRSSARPLRRPRRPPSNTALSANEVSGWSRPLLADLEQLRPGHPGDEPQLLRRSRSARTRSARCCGPRRTTRTSSPRSWPRIARAQGLQALVRVNGNALRLKALLSAGIPVLVETWYEPKPNDGMGHYRLIVGYDDAAAGVDRLRLLRLARRIKRASRTRASASLRRASTSCGRCSTAPTW